MPVIPTQDRLVIEPYPAETQTEGGIFIPDTATEKPSRARVVAVGPGKYLDNGDLQEMHLRPGDEILFRKNAGHIFEHNGEEVTMIVQDDVLARITPE